MLKNRLFPAQEESEKILQVIRRHWFSYVIFWFLALVMLVPFLIGIAYLMSNLQSISPDMLSLLTLVGSAYLLFVLGLIIYGFIDFYLDVYIITDERIVDIKQNGFFRRVISELNLRQIQDVNAEVNGVFATLLHYGNIYIQTAGERENFYFQEIPHPYEISKKIIDLHEHHLKHSDPDVTDLKDRFEKKIEDKKVFSSTNQIDGDRSEKILRGLENMIRNQKNAVTAESKKEPKKEGNLEEGKRVDI